MIILLSIMNLSVFVTMTFKMIQETSFCETAFVKRER